MINSRAAKWSQAARPRISASLLPLKDESRATILRQCLAALDVGCDMLHFDVLGAAGCKTAVVEQGSVDTKQKLTPALLRALRATAGERGLPLAADVHIMDVAPTNQEVCAWCDAGAQYVVVHWEAFEDRQRLESQLQVIHGRKVRAGLALRPDVEIQQVLRFLSQRPITIPRHPPSNRTFTVLLTELECSALQPIIVLATNAILQWNVPVVVGQVRRLWCLDPN